MAPRLVTMRSRTGPGYFFVPRNIMCSKKWAKPDRPGSTSSRLPVRTTAEIGDQLRASAWGS